MATSLFVFLKAIKKIQDLSKKVNSDDKEKQRELLEKCAATALSSKLVARQKNFFSKMVVDAVTSLDELLPLNMIGMKKVQGGALEVRVYRLFFLD